MARESGPARHTFRGRHSRGDAQPHALDTPNGGSDYPQPHFASPKISTCRSAEGCTIPFAPAPSTKTLGVTLGSGNFTCKSYGLAIVRGIFVRVATSFEGFEPLNFFDFHTPQQKGDTNGRRKIRSVET